MLELRTKWMTNTLAKESILKKDFILCGNGDRLFILGYGELTSSGKNTYNYEVKDMVKDVVVSSGVNAYLDKLTTLVKENKDTKDVKKVKASKATKENKEDESLLFTFDEAFDKACNLIQDYKEVALKLGKYNTSDAITLTMSILEDAHIRETKRIKEKSKNEALSALYKTLELAKASANKELINSIVSMIEEKEQE